MSRDRKEEIILATLELAAQSGLGSVSMSQIADKVGIRKPSLYNHFQSREEIVEAMYGYLRENAKKNANLGMTDYGELVKGKKAIEVLQMVVDNYKRLNMDEKMQMFYKVIYSQRSFQPMAAKIMVEETEKMMIATKQLFYAMQVHGLLEFSNVDMAAVTFAMTIHALMDYGMDQKISAEMGTETGSEDDPSVTNEMISEYLLWFCNEYKVCIII